MNTKFTTLASLYIIIITIFIYVGIELTKQNNEKVSEILKLKEQIENNNSEILQLKTDVNNKDTKLNEISEELDVLREENERLKEDFKKYENLESLNVTATAYTSYCDGCSGFTKNETDVRNTIYKDGLRVIAVDQRVIPLNSIVYVETEEDEFLAVADDIGGAIKGNKIDILVPNKKVAYKFGRQENVKVTIIKRG